MLMRMGSGTALEGTSMLKGVFGCIVHISDSAYSNEISESSRS
jgi:hypothetical protein